MTVDIANQIKEQMQAMVGKIDEANQKQADEIAKFGKASEEAQAEHKEAINGLEARFTAMERLAVNLQQQSQPVSEQKQVEMFNKFLKVANKEAMNSEQVVEYKSAFEKYITRGERQLTPDEVKFLNTASDPSGGYLVVPEVSTTLVNKKFDGRGILEVVAKKTTSGQYEEIIDWEDYDEGFFNNELDLDVSASISTSEQFGKVTFSNDEILYGKKFTRKVLEDAFLNIETDVMGKVDKGMRRTIAQLLLTGTGVNEPKGLLTYTDGTTFGTIEQVETGTSGDLTWADVISTAPASLKDGYHANASFLMRRATFFNLLKEVDTTGQYQLGQMINFMDGQGVSFNILGYPVNFDAGMPAVAGGALAVAFGDFNTGYVYTETPAVSIVRDDTKPTYVEIWKRLRADGKVVDFDAIKLLKIKA